MSSSKLTALPSVVAADPADLLYLVTNVGTVPVSNKITVEDFQNSISPPVPDQVANVVFAGPAAGIAAPPTFRALVTADIPSLPYVPTTPQSGRTVLASPLDGSSGTPSFLSIASNYISDFGSAVTAIATPIASAAATAAASAALALAVILTPLTSARNTIQSTADASALILKAPTAVNVPSPTANILKIQNDAGTGFTSVGPTGILSVQAPVTVASLGSELVTNGGFNPDLTGWTVTTWTSGSNRANYAGTTGAIDTVANGGIRLNFGGTGYTVNDVLTLTNGGNDATMTVTTVSSGVITAFTLTNAGTACTVNLAVSVTGGTGSGAQFAIAKLVNSANTLSQSVGAVNTGVYRVVYTTTRSAGELLVTLGGVNGHAVVAAGTFTQVITATGTGALTFTPTVDFTGSVTNVSVKLISTTTAPEAILNSDGTSGTELRAGGPALNNMLEGYQAGNGITTGANNVILGYGAGRTVTTGSNGVYIGYLVGSSLFGGVFIGAQAGKVNTAGGGTFIGNQSGAANTTGASNTFLGSSSGVVNTTGSSNVFLGQATGFVNLSGSSNTFVGNQSGAGNTTASNNTFVGANSGLANTTGASNVFVGASAGAANKTGGTNVVIGNSAALTMTTGSSNVIVGASAVNSGILTGSGNTIIGQNSSAAVTSASNNVVVGNTTAALLTTGGSNVVIGTSAGGNITTGIGNVFIGANSGGFETGSNKLYIHPTNSMTPLVWGDFAAVTGGFNAAVGVRTMNPQASLDVVGVDVLSTSFAARFKSTSAELITNLVDRDFSGSPNWSGANWSLVSAAWKHTTGATTDTTLANGNMTASSIVANRSYKLVFTISGATGGTVTPKLGTGAGTAVGKNTTYTQYIVPSGANVALIFTPTTDFDGSLDNISLTGLADIVTIANDGVLTYAGSTITLQAASVTMSAATNWFIRAGGTLSLNDNASHNVEINTGGGLTAIGASVASPYKLIINTGTNTNIGLGIRGVASQSGDLQRWENSTPTTVGSISSIGAATFSPIDTGTAAVLNVLTLNHTLTTANAGANGIGTGIQFAAADSTSAIGAAVNQGLIRTTAVDATHASFKSNMIFSVYSTTTPVDVLTLAAATITVSNAIDFVFNTSTGTKFGTATSQKMGWWNATPIVQPTTAFAAATFVANSGTAINDASTFDGYTLKQVVAALRAMGKLA